ncbi:MAG: hypothetical protein WD273_09890 [Trueperaceae bacterium]
MGMFDWLTFENDIPDPNLREREWQTKSLENAMLRYRVTEGGELFVTRNELRARDDSESFLGISFEVVREWEENVGYHGVIEAYTYERLADDSSHTVTYRLYFTYGRLTSLERDEQTHPPVKRMPPQEDESPRWRVTTGKLEVDFPETMQATLMKQEGQLYVFRVAFDGYLNAWIEGNAVSLRGVKVDLGMGPTIRSSGNIKHVEGDELEVLVENKAGEYLIIIAPKGYAQEGNDRARNS